MSFATSERPPAREDFIPPHSEAAERAVLGAILLDNAAIHRVLGVLSSEDFYGVSHRRIFEAIVALSEAAAPIDLVTLREELTVRGTLDEAGGPATIAGLLDGVPASANVEYYARIVAERAGDRVTIRECGALQQAIVDRNGAGPGEARESIREIAGRLIQAIESSIRRPVVAPADLATLLAEPEQPTVSLVQGLIEAGAASLGSGPPKSFKSTTAVAAGLSVAAGIEFAGHFRTVRVPFLHIDAEMGVRRTLALYRRVALGEGIDLLGLARDGLLHYLDATRPGPARDPRAWVRIVRERKAGLVLLDPAVALYTGDENAATEVRSWWGRFVRPLLDEGAAVAIVHHTRKGSPAFADTAADSPRGSGDWRGAPDLHFGVRAEPSDRCLLRVEVTGSRLGPEPAPFYLRVEDHEGGQRIRWAGEAQEAFGKGHAAADAIGELLERAGDPGMSRPHIIEALKTTFPLRTLEEALSTLRDGGSVTTRKVGRVAVYQRIRG